MRTLYFRNLIYENQTSPNATSESCWALKNVGLENFMQKLCSQIEWCEHIFCIAVQNHLKLKMIVYIQIFDNILLPE